MTYITVLHKQLIRDKLRMPLVILSCSVSLQPLKLWMHQFATSRKMFGYEEILEKTKTIGRCLR